MLAGQQSGFMGMPPGTDALDTGIGASMFETLGGARGSRPDPDEMARAMERATVDRKVEVKEFVARTYNLGDEQSLQQYQYDMEALFLGVRLRTHALIHREPLQFINDAAGPRYIAHLQWVEFRLLQKPAVPAGRQEDNHDQ